VKIGESLDIIELQIRLFIVGADIEVPGIQAGIAAIDLEAEILKAEVIALLLSVGRRRRDNGQSQNEKRESGPSFSHGTLLGHERILYPVSFTNAIP
jgi:hypothetical protein